MEPVRGHQRPFLLANIQCRAGFPEIIGKSAAEQSALRW